MWENRSVLVKGDCGRERVEPFPITEPLCFSTCAVFLYWGFVSCCSERVVKIWKFWTRKRRSMYMAGGVSSGLGNFGDGRGREEYGEEYDSPHDGDDK